jgi:hypothetical protein
VNSRYVFSNAASLGSTLSAETKPDTLAQDFSWSWLRNTTLLSESQAEGGLVMKKTDGITDVGEMKDRMMIDLFKKKLQEARTDPTQLRGTWSEASEILKTHFGKISRTMVSNENKLRNLYQTAIDELRKESG